MATDLSTRPLEELIQELPTSLRSEVRNYVEFLLTKYETSSGRRLRQDWSNALHGSQYSSVELQHLATQWRNE